MRKLRSLWRRAFDIRDGERLRTLFMGLYFLFVLFANDVLKAVSKGLFLNRFDVSQLPYLYLLIAAAGGLLTYLYTKILVVHSLRSSVAVATGACVVVLMVFWRLIDIGSDTLLYGFSTFVSLIGIVFFSQGWLLAADIFDSREAKRLYGLLGLGAVVGAALGGSFVAFTVRRLGTKNLLPVAALSLLAGYLALHLATRQQRQHPRSPVRERAGDEKEVAARFTFRDLILALARHRHLLVIVGIITITFFVEELVEFQFNAMAQETYKGDRLTAFFGKFSGVYVSLTTFVLQFFFTTLAVGRLGVGQTLLISPLTVAATAVGVVIVPSLLTASAARLGESATRYSINRTAIELLYLPLPAELKNRTKAFIDVFVDRFGRGLAALLLLGLTTVDWATPRHLSVLVGGLALVWAALAIRAKREYLTTVRKRVEARRLDLESARITVQDTETVRLLEHVARGSNPRQVLYALSLLEETPGYGLAPLLEEITASPNPLVRAKVYQLARKAEFDGLLDRAVEEVRSGVSLPPELASEAVAYIFSVTPAADELARQFLNGADTALAEAVLSALAGRKELVQVLITHEWLNAAASSEALSRRALAAFAVGVRGDEGTGVLHDLLRDPAAGVARAAIRSAGLLRNRSYLNLVIHHLGDPELRSAAVDALSSYGEAICETLGKHLVDPAAASAVRRQIPRVLAAIPSQRSVDELERGLRADDVTLRTAVLRGLNRLRETAPSLQHEATLVSRHIRAEALLYYQLFASLQKLRKTAHGGKATALLARTLEDRLKQTIGRLFALLGLRYPPSSIHAAYLAVSHRRPEEYASALELLDNLLEQDLKVFLLPMIDGSPHLVEIGQDVFGIDVPDFEAAIRQQLGSGDSWLVACAVAAAAELRLKGLLADIDGVSRGSDPAAAQVARQAAAALA